LTPRFSLIISTLNRTWQLERFLKHLREQSCQDFECIIVDQNKDQRLAPIINEYKEHLTLIHMHSEQGISLGRNTGFAASRGKFLAFPDDDCWYGSDQLQIVDAYLTDNPEIDFLTGRTIDARGITSLGKFDKKAGAVTRENIFERGNTNTFFLRRQVAGAISFDESIGLGPQSKWGSGEETDYLFQALAAGFNLYYDPDLTVYHDEPIIEYNEAAIKRGYSYGRGMGRVMKMNGYPFRLFLAKLFRQGGGMVVALIKLDFNRFKYHRAVLKGRLEGWQSRDA
jgi:glycosyltransferase involved in cell wall biosynthesis